MESVRAQESSHGSSASSRLSFFLQGRLGISDDQALEENLLVAFSLGLGQKLRHGPRAISLAKLRSRGSRTPQISSAVSGHSFFETLRISALQHPAKRR